METANLLAIELGDFNVASLTDVLWFLVGIVILTGLTALIIRFNHQATPDPFE